MSILYVKSDLDGKTKRARLMRYEALTSKGQPRKRAFVVEKMRYGQSIINFHDEWDARVYLVEHGYMEVERT